MNELTEQMNVALTIEREYIDRCTHSHCQSVFCVCMCLNEKCSFKLNLNRFIDVVVQRTSNAFLNTICCLVEVRS